MAVLFNNRDFHTNGIESLLGSGFLSAGCLGSQLRMNCEDAQEDLHKFDVEEAAEDDPTEFPQPQAKKRRLTDDQVRFLERSFALENKLEPERKLQLARDLGLKPRQVAVWFQNRRARWKTKQMEKEYESLKCSYDSLKVDCESLLKEKEKLRSEVACLARKLLHKEENKRKKSNSADDEALLHKQEEVSASSSMIPDSDQMRHRADVGGLSELVLEEPTSPTNSPFELGKPGVIEGEIERALGFGFGHRPELHSCSHEFQVEEQAFWLWS